MIPVSLVVVVVGGWTAVYLTDLVLKVRASGLKPKPAVSRVGRKARGLFSSPASRLPGWKLRGQYPRALFRVAPGPRGVNKTADRGRGVAVCAAAAVALRGGAGPAAFGSCPGGASSGLGRVRALPDPAAVHLGGK